MEFSRSAAPQGELSKIAWLGAVVRTVQNVVRSRDWRHAFLMRSSREATHVFPEIVKIFVVADTATNWAWNARTRPDVATVSRKRKRLNVPAIVQWPPDMHSCPAKPVETWD